MVIKILAIDPSFANTGWCLATVDPGAASIVEMHDGGLVCTEKAEIKTIRRSSDDLRRAHEIASKLRDLSSGVDLVFAEIPTGTQSARASWALGIALGCLTNIAPTPIIEITPTMTKLASVGRKDASKEEIINWAVDLYPDLPWIKARGKEKLSPKNEHMADSVGVLCAGLNHEDFRMWVSIRSKLMAKVSHG
jgi:Holliday junction resolvasome RuvABC endonuclease subunit